MQGERRIRGAAVLIGAVAATGLLALGSRAIGAGPLAFTAPGPLDAGLASTSLRVDSLALRPAAADGLEAQLDLRVTNVGTRDAVGVGYVLLDDGVVVDYDERQILVPGSSDHATLTWVPKGHNVHTIRVVAGDGNVHWVKHELSTGVFNDSTVAARRHRSAGAFALVAVAGALVVGMAGAVTPHLARVRTYEVVAE
jgi:hypothetical protein